MSNEPKRVALHRAVTEAMESISKMGAEGYISAKANAWDAIGKLMEFERQQAIEGHKSETHGLIMDVAELKVRIGALEEMASTPELSATFEPEVQSEINRMEAERILASWQLAPELARRALNASQPTPKDKAQSITIGGIIYRVTTTKTTERSIGDTWEAVQSDVLRSRLLNFAERGVIDVTTSADECGPVRRLIDRSGTFYERLSGNEWKLIPVLTHKIKHYLESLFDQ